MWLWATPCSPFPRRQPAQPTVCFPFPSHPKAHARPHLRSGAHPHLRRHRHPPFQTPQAAARARLHRGRFPGRPPHALHPLRQRHGEHTDVGRHRRDIPHVHPRPGIFVQENREDGHGTRHRRLLRDVLHDERGQRGGPSLRVGQHEQPLPGRYARHVEYHDYLQGFRRPRAAAEEICRRGALRAHPGGHPGHPSHGHTQRAGREPSVAGDGTGGQFAETRLLPHPVVRGGRLRRAPVPAENQPVDEPRDIARGEHRAVFPARGVRREGGLQFRLRRVHDGQHPGRNGAGGEHRARGVAGEGPFRRHLLRVGGHVGRPRRARALRPAHRGHLPGHHGGTGRVRLVQLPPLRPAPAHGHPGRFLVGTDWRVRLHHRFAGHFARRDGPFPLPRGGGRQYHHHLLHALHDPGRRSRGRVGGAHRAGQRARTPRAAEPSARGE